MLKMTITRTLMLLLGLLLITSVQAKTWRFAVIPKDQSNPFFQQVKIGCERAAKALGNVECVFEGPNKANAISQHLILEKLIDQGIDGVAFSVLLDSYVARRTLPVLVKNDIPLVTFDSDIDDSTAKRFPNVRKAYIGTNNFDLGVKLGLTLKSMRPEGGTLCIQTGRKDSVNLDERISGIRAALSVAEPKLINPARIRRLVNINGWTEHADCPLYSWSDQERAVKQLQDMLTRPDNIAVVAVGGWPQYHSSYPTMMKQLKVSHPNHTLLVADTTQEQLDLLQQGLSKINVGQKPAKMGEQAIHTLYKIVTDQAYEPQIFTELTHCTQDNYARCTQ
ncbi:sugar ABC transporter substrate-binding protein [Saccharobesus litoralis]|uniref:Sugar ABC transporter substrate-binding protein n=1 Tax=Saccharobesus litoralis TaxID=2172099 RepID=A0A2S0VNE6_9ALTE|nr:substrate-binding domain-containing protein [Saccharobesus litoralis]AWB65735.1 sugar ABC transporter substrate-binding protein [Saccharobesus litoralis]